jgi:MauM/NapG family ferredoxin protein
MVNEENQKKTQLQSNPRKWHRIRLAVQILVLFLFIYLLLGTTQTALVPTYNIFFHLDPLVGISSMISSRSWIAPMALGFFVLILTFVVGSIIDWTPSRRLDEKKLDIAPFWRQGKYLSLFAIFFAAILGSLTLMVLDPITLLFRSVTSFILPVVSWVVIQSETWLYNFQILQPAVGWFDSALRNAQLITEQPFYLPNLWIAFLFIGVLSLNAIRPRFWCRYLCPLGGLLALVSKFPLIRYRVDEGKCISCQRCAVICHTGAIDPAQKFAANSAECTTCLDCVEECPTHAITFPRHSVLIPDQYQDPLRRQFLASIGAAAIGAVLLRTIPAVLISMPRFLRPPGASDEKLLSACVRCGECVKVCPTGVIQPGSSASSWNELWTPILNTRLGYCDYSCTSCGEVCPTEAIPMLSLEKKRKEIIGKVYIDRERCIPWADGTECIVCEEICPIPDKAIKLGGRGNVSGAYSNGADTTVKLPRVIDNLCNGCGICEYHCPIDGESAIRVYRQ